MAEYKGSQSVEKFKYRAERGMMYYRIASHKELGKISDREIADQVNGKVPCRSSTVAKIRNSLGIQRMEDSCLDIIIEAHENGTIDLVWETAPDIIEKLELPCRVNTINYARQKLNVSWQHRQRRSSYRKKEDEIAMNNRLMKGWL